MGVGGGGGLVWELGGSLRRDNICPHQIPFSSSEGGVGGKNAIWWK